MKILSETVARGDLLGGSEVVFDEMMVKGVVDVGRGVVAVDAELHADLEQMLLADGGKQEDLWGVNFYPEEEELVEFDSMINVRPRQGNRSRGVEDAATREKILEVVGKWIR